MANNFGIKMPQNKNKMARRAGPGSLTLSTIVQTTNMLGVCLRHGNNRNSGY